jgi:type VI protein secretion system component VasK
MIDASVIMILATVASVFLWTTLIFKIVMSPFTIPTKWKLVGILFVFALCYIYVPYWIYSSFQMRGYGVPSLIMSALFVGLCVMYALIKAAIKRYDKKNP